MRLRLTLQPKSFSLVLPIHYNELIQAFIYRNLSEDLATFLHNKGFSLSEGKRKFKLFTFSRLLCKVKPLVKDKQI